MSNLIAPHLLRAPDDLATTPWVPRRVLIVGSCLSEGWAARMMALPHPCESDIYLLGQQLPEAPRKPIERYDFQIVQLALRFVLPDASFARLGQSDIAGHETLFDHAVNATKRYLADAMRWNRQYGILTFAFPFITPLQNAVGRLMPRYDLRNPVYFIEKLNEALTQELQSYTNTYLFDINEIHSFYGRRFVQEDMFLALNHGGLTSDFDHAHDQNRLEPASKASHLFKQDVWSIFLASWQELLSLYRTVLQADMVKMVVVDLDDTLWRGVIAELDMDDMPTSEGWPRGLWEALLVLKRRGILLAIISKNEEARVNSFWNAIFHGSLTQEDFVVRRINWRPKPENLQEILTQVNLLPQNVVYIDDNPAERAAIKAAFPDIRILGGTPLAWRRILLWSAETQLPDITPESATRTQMVQAQGLREEHRKDMSREAFLAALTIKMAMFEISGADHPRFSRALELINKTNQFNTTGRRWTLQECVAAFGDGMRFFAFEVTDLYTEYGLVGVVVTDQTGIRQFVMSCRVMGLDVECAAVAEMNALFLNRGATELYAAMVKTDRNLPCQDIFARCGFAAVEGGWRRPTSPPLSMPRHITLLRSPLVSLVDKAVPETTRLVEEVVFGRACGNEADRIRDGWAQPEPLHRWAIGLSSEIELGRPDNGDMLIEFEVWPFTHPPTVPSQRLFVQANDTPVGELVITENCRASVRVPASAFAAHPTLRLRFDHPDAARPADFRSSNDTRYLAVCFRRLRVFAITPGGTLPPGQTGRLEPDL